MYSDFKGINEVGWHLVAISIQYVYGVFEIFYSGRNEGSPEEE